MTKFTINEIISYKQNMAPLFRFIAGIANKQMLNFMNTGNCNKNSTGEEVIGQLQSIS